MYRSVSGTLPEELCPKACFWRYWVEEQCTRDASNEYVDYCSALKMGVYQVAQQTGVAESTTTVGIFEKRAGRLD